MRRTTAAVIAASAAALLWSAAASTQPLPPIEGGEVRMPLSELEALIDKQAREDDSDTPLPLALGPATLSVRVSPAPAGQERRRATVSVNVTVESFSDGLHVIPLLPADSAIRSATLGGRAAMLAPVEGGRLGLLVDGRQSARFVAEVEVWLVRQGGHWTGQLPGLMAPTTRVDLEVTGEEVDASIAGTALVPEPGSEALSAAVPAAGTYALRFEPRREATAEARRRVEVLDQTSIEVREERVEVEVTLDVQVRSGQVESLQVDLPAGAEGVTFSSPALLSTEGEGRRRTLRFKYPLSDQTRLVGTFNLGSERPATFTLPDVDVVGDDLERGFYAVRASGGVAVELIEGGLENLTAIDESELPAGLSAGHEGDVLFAFKSFRAPVKARFSTTRHAREEVLSVAVEDLRLRTVLTREGHAVTLSSFTMVNNGLQFLSLDLPEGVQVWSAFVDGRGVKPARDKEGRLLLPIRRSARVGERMEPFTVELVTFQTTSAMSRAIGGRVLAAPSVDLVVSEVRWDIYAPKGYLYYGFEGNLEYEGLSPLAFRDEVTVQDRFVTLAKPEEKEEELADKEKAPEDAQFDYKPSPNKPEASGVARRGMSRGVLPVQLDIPTVGVHHSLHRTIVKPGEALYVDFGYISMPLVRAADWLSLALLVLTALALLGHLWTGVVERTGPHRHRWWPLTLGGVVALVAVQASFPVPFPSVGMALLFTLGAVALWGGVRGALWLRQTGADLWQAYWGGELEEDE